MADNLRTSVFSSGAQKLLLYPDHVNTFLYGGQPLPICVEIQPTELCNHRCPQCQAKYSFPLSSVRRNQRSGVNLPLHVIDSLWGDLSKPAGLVISGTTGDPLLYPDIVPLMNSALTARIPVALITNAEGLTQPIMASALLACRGIRISLDAGNAAMATRTHGISESSWDHVLENIRMLLAMRAAAGLTSAECLIGAGYLVGKQTQSGMMDATILCKDLGLDYIQFRPFHYELTDISQELTHVLPMAVHGFQVFVSMQKYDQAGTERPYARCHGAYFFSVIDPHGDVYICCHHVGVPRGKLGSFRGSSWPELMTGVQRVNVIQKFDVSGCIPFCRLDSHNRLLHALMQGNQVNAVTLADETIRHAMFL